MSGIRRGFCTIPSPLHQYIVLLQALHGSMAGSYGIVMSRADLSVRLVAMIICEHTSSQLSDIKQSLVSFESQFCHSFAKVKSTLQDSIQVVVDCRLMQCYAVPLLEKNDHVFDATLSRFLLKVESILPFPNLNLCCKC